MLHGSRIKQARNGTDFEFVPVCLVFRQPLKTPRRQGLEFATSASSVHPSLAESDYRSICPLPVGTPRARWVRQHLSVFERLDHPLPYSNRSTNTSTGLRSGGSRVVSGFAADPTVVACNTRQATMARAVAVLAAVLFTGQAYAQTGTAKVLKASDAYKPADSKGTTLISPNKKGIEIFVDNADLLAPLGPAISDVKMTRYADPVYDAEFKGRPLFWMGLGEGGCGYGNLLDPNKYPYMFGMSLSAAARKALGFDGKDGVGCGACIRATCIDEYKPYCPLGATTAVGVVLDVCPDEPGHESGKACQEMQADMYIKAWEYATGNSPSNPKMLLQRVQCPDPKTNIMMMVKSNMGPWQFLKIALQNVGGTGVIKAVEMTCMDARGKNPSTVSLENTYGGVWQIDNQPQYIDQCYLTIHSEDKKETLESGIFTKLPVDTLEDYPFVSIIDLGVQFTSAPLLGSATAPAPAIMSNSSSTLALAGRRLLHI